MPNIAKVLKEEITRLARKEIRKETAALQKASSQYRREIAALKRQVAALQRQVSLLEPKEPIPTPEVPSADDGKRRRFAAKGLRSQRKRLGLSVPDYARLAGVSAQSIRNWESGATRPQKAQILVLAKLRTIGKREANARLQQLADRKK